VTAQPAASVASFATPTTLAEAVALKQSLGEEALYVAGATDVGVQLRRRLLEPAHLIGLGGLAELKGIEDEDGEIGVGGGVTHRELERSPLLEGGAVALREACRTVGAVQTRNVGTIGGNLANASPAADTAPVLLALRAAVDVTGPDGDRTILIDDFFTGYRRTALAPAEVIHRIRIPAAAGPRGSAFLKLGRRKAMEISIVCVAVSLELEDDGTIGSAGIGLGSVAEVAVRAAAAEEALVGASPDEGVLAAASAAAADTCRPIDDVRATAAYRRAMVPVLVGRALRLALQRTEAAV
jgi:carbon-monoxide dehydrogenase medium subunit